jgi:hypothetical protein
MGAATTWLRRNTKEYKIESPVAEALAGIIITNLMNAPMSSTILLSWRAYKKRSGESNYLYIVKRRRNNQNNEACSWWGKIQSFVQSLACSMSRILWLAYHQRHQIIAYEKYYIIRNVILWNKYLQQIPGFLCLKITKGQNELLLNY